MNLLLTMYLQNLQTHLKMPFHYKWDSIEEDHHEQPKKNKKYLSNKLLFYLRLQSACCKICVAYIRMFKRSSKMVIRKNVKS